MLALKESFHLNADNDSPLLYLAIMATVLVFAILIGILLIKGFNKGSHISKEIGYNFINMNLILTAIPFFLLTAPVFFELNSFPLPVIVTSMLICWTIPIIRNFSGCKKHIGLAIFYTIMHFFIGFLIGVAGIAVLALAVFAIVIFGAFTAQKTEVYNIELAPVTGAGFISIGNDIRARRNENNPNQLIGENGEIFESNGNGLYTLIFSHNSSDNLFDTYTIV